MEKCGYFVIMAGLFFSGAIEAAIPDPLPERGPLPICYLPIEKGLCEGGYEVYSWDAKQQKCVQYNYAPCGGGGGNRNNFNTMLQCEIACNKEKGLGYTGCYGDEQVLGDNARFVFHRRYLEDCYNFCKGSHYAYYIMQKGRECYCQNNPDFHLGGIGVCDQLCYEGFDCGGEHGIAIRKTHVVIEPEITTSQIGCQIGDGMTYMGKQDKSFTGRKCQRWDTQTPQAHSFIASDFPDASLAEASNYCRNPDYSIGPWCYVVEAEWRKEYCDIPLCIVRDRLNLALNKPAGMNSIAFGAIATRAVDGNAVSTEVFKLEDGIWKSTCIHTAGDYQPFWAVDLEQVTHIVSVQITNRAEASHRFADFQIGTTDIDPFFGTAPVIGGYPVCASQVPAMGAGETKEFACAATARYVIVQLKGNNALTLCEVEVFGPMNSKTDSLVNLALKKPAFKKDETYGAVASRALDGNAATGWSKFPCTHTVENSHQPWWAVDLTQITQVTSVKITNRNEASEHLVDFQIGTTILDPNVTAPVIGGYPVCASQVPAMGAGETKEFACAATGRYVIVQFKGDYPLTLCDVEVYGSIISETLNIALGKPVMQSSLRPTLPDEKHSSVASWAVDGSTVTETVFCARTIAEHNPWWAVDLGAKYRIRRVRIAGPGGYSHSFAATTVGEFKIGVYDANVDGAPPLDSLRVCHYQEDAIPCNAIHDFDCRDEGRYVTIVSVYMFGSLAVCEVEVLGELIDPTDFEHENIAWGKPAYQSSTLHFDELRNGASLAVDGNRNTDLFVGRSCSHTQLEQHGWWAVDLEFKYAIRLVGFTTRHDCYATVLKNLVIGTRLISPYDERPEEGNMQVIASEDAVIPNGQKFTYRGRVEGRYVVILQNGVRNYLSLCEVEVFGDFLPNVALGKNALQTDTFLPRPTSEAMLAVDGNKNPFWNSGFCSRTTGEGTYNWWAVVLGAVYKIYGVRVTNRDSSDGEPDPYDNGLENFRIGGTNVDPLNRVPTENNTMLCASYEGHMLDGETRGFVCEEPLQASYLAVMMPGENKFLILCEVEVFGEWLNVALGKAAYQSSTLDDDKAMFGAQLAVDGHRENPANNNMSPTCAHTNVIQGGDAVKNWWAVDLGRIYMIQCVHVIPGSSIIIEGDGFLVGTMNSNPVTTAPTETSISIGGFGDAEIMPGSSSTQYIFTYHWIPAGRYVVLLYLIDSYLELCEVEVNGYIDDIEACASNPCENNGTCTDLKGRYECACQSGFTGSTCEESDAAYRKDEGQGMNDDGPVLGAKSRPQSAVSDASIGTAVALVLVLLVAVVTAGVARVRSLKKNVDQGDIKLHKFIQRAISLRQPEQACEEAKA